MSSNVTATDEHSHTHATPPPIVSRQRLAVIGALRSVGGNVEDKSGRATAVLKTKMPGAPNDKALSALLANMDRDGVIERDIRGKRTFGITLVGYAGYEESEGSLGKVEPVAPIPQIEPVVVPVPTPQAPTPLPNYDRLAHALLIEVGSILANGKATGKDELLIRVHSLTQANLRLSRRVEIAEDLVVAKDRELEGLRKRLAQAEINIAKMLKQAGVNGLPMDGKSQRAIERFMQERPHERVT